jgi:predicted N-acetyltransferase YhbS
MHIRSVRSIEIDHVRQLLQECGWEHRLADLRRLEDLIARSQVALVAVDEEQRVIGFVRALSDGISNGYISMLAVSEPHRRKGVGAALIRECIGQDAGMTWVLRAGRPGLTAFYERFGFRTSSVAMERPRAPAGDA